MKKLEKYGVATADDVIQGEWGASEEYRANADKRYKE